MDSQNVVSVSGLGFTFLKDNLEMITDKKNINKYAKKCKNIDRVNFGILVVN